MKEIETPILRFESEKRELLGPPQVFTLRCKDKIPTLPNSKEELVEESVNQKLVHDEI